MCPPLRFEICEISEIFTEIAKNPLWPSVENEQGFENSKKNALENLICEKPELVCYI